MLTSLNSLQAEANQGLLVEEGVATVDEMLTVPAVNSSHDAL